ncbi:MAG: YCF48-related protein [Saprospiraceae bacterium]|nr:YCF48-related protein [Saprospiraceae bacterium]
MQKIILFLSLFGAAALTYLPAQAPLGGDCWALLNPLPLPQGNDLLCEVFFTDSLTGWVLGEEGAIFKTVDGGVTWTAQYSGTGELLYSGFFTDSLTGWAVGSDGIILKTVDGGTT